MAGRDAEARVVVRARRKGEQVFDQLERQLKSLREKSNTLGFAAGAAAASLAVIVANSIKSNVELVRLGRTVGVNSQAMSEWAHAAQTVEVQGDKVADIFKDVSERIGEFAATGGGEGADVFEKLNLDVREFVGLSPDQQLLKVAGALDQVQSRSEKIFLLEALASDASRLLPLLENNAAGLRALQAEARSLGTSISSIDAAKLEAANRSMERVQALASGAATRFSVELAPIIEVVANELVAFATEGERLQTIIHSTFTGGAKVVGVFADGVHGIRVIFKGLELVITGFGAVVASVFELTVKAIFNLASEVNETINALIEGMNKLPKVNIPLLETDVDQFAAVQFVETLGNAMRDKTAIVRAELHEMLMQDLPSSVIKANVDRILKEAEEAAARGAAEARARLAAEANTDVLKPIVVTNERREGTGLSEQAARELEQVQATLLAREQLEAQAYVRRLEVVRLNRELGLIEEQEAQNLRVQLFQRFQDRLTAIEVAGQTERQKFQAKSGKDQAKDVFTTLENITAGVAHHNKAMFRINQAAAIANALVNTYEGVTKTMAKYPYPLNLVFAALHLAAGLAQVNAIRSAQFGGGTTPSLAGSTPTFNDQPVSRETPGSSQQQAGTTIQIIVQGSLVGDQGIKEVLAETFRELADQDIVLLPPNSRTAIEIREGGLGRTGTG